MSKKHMGSSIDDFLKEEGIFEEAQAQPIKEVVAWQLAQAMKKKKIPKSRMAALLKTSWTQVDRLLDPKNDITLSSLQWAAAMVGRRVTIELVWRRAGVGIALKGFASRQTNLLTTSAREAWRAKNPRLTVTAAPRAVLPLTELPRRVRPCASRCRASLRASPHESPVQGNRHRRW
jgi:antitoxin HicB